MSLPKVSRNQLAPNFPLQHENRIVFCRWQPAVQQCVSAHKQALNAAVLRVRAAWGVLLP